MKSELFDVIVIGGGPAGLTAGQYAARANLKVMVLDKPQAAGALILSAQIENYPGLLKPVPGKALLDIFREQALKFGAKYHKDQVIGVNFDADIKEVNGLENNYLGRSVIIATGAMARKSEIPGEAQYIGKGVSYCATCDAAFFREQTVCVIGDSDEAVSEAEHLLTFAKTVYLVTKAREPKRQDLNPAFHLITDSRLISVNGDDVVRNIIIRHHTDGKEQLIQTDGVFIYLHGATPSVDFLDSSVSKGDNACILTHQTTATSIPGVYAAGDVTCSAVRQVVVSAAFGCIAALEAEKYLRRRKGLRYDWAKQESK
jgi:thioredoxin reductase (NADPH)